MVHILGSFYTLYRDRTWDFENFIVELDEADSYPVDHIEEKARIIRENVAEKEIARVILRSYKVMREATDQENIS